MEPCSGWSEYYSINLSHKTIGQNKDAVLRAGGIVALVSMLSSSSETAQWQATGAIADLCYKRIR